ncbi:30S ribosomal protein S3 [Chlorobium phaeovibrioides]|uniref:Small ribosomal subunit protein uS3 n=1 Tax=Chlorobium phaeovibrioides TaxID=1094 RepID=A0A432AU58_CHLPH|nr:30S ribosomal protein S3 [Chlorobium phaeovibrioides]KAA6231902.1 30S ribosomal protein S3 [Chlorobium phaeovibrioides]MWV53520.1 30S ribosomal protein S3 [Chlorobium phaeovibrioides]QEQ57546.1 30S ribosomal protein S3 [Chlorobium phaeovibrioides]RTY36176.1 30S ribosomal protein S3 [Chlorobium phaeovibrioides]RTY37808.1 30S ribosomal protein S3 [Chlorobium phaeovibrioides]
MGQKVNPTGFRLGIIRDWTSRWYDDSPVISEKIKQDQDIRNYVQTRLKREKAGIARIIIERTNKNIRINIYAARPGAVVGRKGEEINNLSQELGRITGKEVKIDVVEVVKPEIESQLIGENIAYQLENRVSFRRAMKQAIQTAMRAGAEGVRIRCAGRLGGAEIARAEQYKEGKIPLHTIRANVDYASVTAHTIAGTIGIKVWVYKGEVLVQRIDAIEEEEMKRIKERRSDSGPRSRDNRNKRRRRPAGRP